MTHRAPYSPQFRAEAVQLIRSSGKSLAEIGRELQVTTETLRIWSKQADIDDGVRNDGLTTAETEELRRLRRENQVRCWFLTTTLRRTVSHCHEAVSRHSPERSPECVPICVACAPTSPTRRDVLRDSEVGAHSPQGGAPPSWRNSRGSWARMRGRRGTRGRGATVPGAERSISSRLGRSRADGYDSTRLAMSAYARAAVCSSAIPTYSLGSCAWERLPGPKMTDRML